MKFKSLLLRQRAASDFRLRRVFRYPGGKFRREPCRVEPPEKTRPRDGNFPAPGPLSSVSLFKGIAQGQLGTDVVHQGHHMDGLLVRHGGALQTSLPDALRRLLYLVLIAC